jgi:RES domain-containing protein
MPTDDAPTEFPSWRSYWRFAAEVSHRWRYVQSPETADFLKLVARQARDRLVDMAAGQRFYRAQKAAHDWFDQNLGEAVDGPALPERMTPLPGTAAEGRVNPKGIPCFYMAGDEHTAIAEVRPWIGSKVSVGLFRTVRDLRLVDCTRDAERQPIYFDEPDVEARTKAVWTHIAQAFREPVTREDDRADYAPTQIVAETFRAEGFDGVAYRSGFGTDRFNVALFALDATDLEMCSIYEIRDVTLDYKMADNPYYVQTDDDGNRTLVRNVITAIHPIDKKE